MSEGIKAKVFVVIPAYNEEKSVGKVIGDLPRSEIEEIIVVNNNSSDKTSEEARKAGATVLDEKIKGYGRACLKALTYIETKATGDDIVAFIDADYSDYPAELSNLLIPVYSGQADMVIGSRYLGISERGSMTFPQRFGNWLSGHLINLIYGVRFTDLGPFRVINYAKLKELEMCDQNFGWTVEMQIKAVKKKLKCVEIPVNYKKRIGVSKVSGTVRGSVSAAYKIIYTILKYS